MKHMCGIVGGEEEILLQYLYIRNMAAKKLVPKCLGSTCCVKAE